MLAIWAMKAHFGWGFLVCEALIKHTDAETNSNGIVHVVTCTNIDIIKPTINDPIATNPN